MVVGSVANRVEVAQRSQVVAVQASAAAIAMRIRAHDRFGNLALVGARVVAEAAGMADTEDMAQLVGHDLLVRLRRILVQSHPVLTVAVLSDELRVLDLKGLDRRIAQGLVGRNLASAPPPGAGHGKDAAPVPVEGPADRVERVLEENPVLAGVRPGVRLGWRTATRDGQTDVTLGVAVPGHHRGLKLGPATARDAHLSARGDRHGETVPQVEVLPAQRHQIMQAVRPGPDEPIR